MKLWLHPCKKAFTSQNWGISPTLQPILRVLSVLSISTPVAVSYNGNTQHFPTLCVTSYANNVKSVAAHQYECSALRRYGAYATVLTTWLQRRRSVLVSRPSTKKRATCVARLSNINYYGQW